MNKYIRTKDRIYKLLEIDSCGVYFTDDLKHFYKSEIIAEADTIEELCDEFVYVEYKKPRVLDRVITREIKEKGIKVAETIYCHPDWNGIIYGAIWTDKGLIYVAKMNKKGDLEAI